MELLLDALNAQLLTCINQVVVNWLEKQLIIKETIDFRLC
jgi:hypothetical protein